MTGKLNHTLAQEYPNVGNLVKTVMNYQVFFNRNIFKENKLDFTKIKQSVVDVLKEDSCVQYACDMEKNECGLSGQYARFQQGSEYSLEVTWKRQLTESISLQPSFQYIKNDNGDFTALSARLYVSF